MKHSCHDRAPFALLAIPAQDGWFTDNETRTPKLVPLPFRMSKACEYGKEQGRTDPGCEGCKWRSA
jgi:hypothetical protein